MQDASRIPCDYCRCWKWPKIPALWAYTKRVPTGDKIWLLDRVQISKMLSRLSLSSKIPTPWGLAFMRGSSLLVVCSVWISSFTNSVDAHRCCLLLAMAMARNCNFQFIHSIYCKPSQADELACSGWSYGHSCHSLTRELENLNKDMCMCTGLGKPYLSSLQLLVFLG